MDIARSLRCVVARMGVWISGLLLAGGAVAAPAISYVPDTLLGSSAYLVESHGGDAVRLVSRYGAATGTATRQGNISTVRLLATIDAEYYLSDVDACGEQPLVRDSLQRVQFTRMEGTPKLGRSSIVTMGFVTYLTGCEIGKVVPYGSPSDVGWTALHRDMLLRESTADLVPGVYLAGMSRDEVLLPDEPWALLTADIVQFQTGGSLRFMLDGVVVDSTVTPDRWIVLNLNGMQRGYTRLRTDPVTHGESWLEARFEGGVPVTMQQTLMVKPQQGASFGGVAQTARVWASSVTYGEPDTFSIHLYTDGTGDRVSRYADGTADREPVTWHYAGKNVQIDRDVIPGFGFYTRRTWQPLKTRGPVHFVMESEIGWLVGDPAPHPRIPRRVMAYLDDGPAVPPTARATTAPRAKAAATRAALTRRAPAQQLR